MPRLACGMVQVYTGEGKGKTTAALGLALRASGAGLKVYIQQFMKKAKCSELRSISKIKNIRIEQCGHGCFIKEKPGAQDIRCARKGLAKARKNILSGRYDIAILDEVNNAVGLGLVSDDDIIDIITERPRHVELILTGRGCRQKILRRADLVTEMKNVRHPFDGGTRARRGIEY